MKVNYKEGELVYVPSEVTMNKYNSFDSKKCVVDHVTTKTPEYLLVVDQCILSPRELGVFFNGDTWFIDHKDVYSGDRT
jgi:hypothetical protein|tara:strand:- start:260 stop:496 length:237 start_codon:yes stop_codon:yes gene_type:complete